MRWSIEMFDYSRSGRIGGGVALVYHSEFTVKKISYCERSSFEMSEWTLEGEQSSRLSVIYRPPYSAKHPVTTGVFISEFAEYLESFILCTEPVLICGDFNIHIDNSADPDGEVFCDLLTSMGLKQHVNTHTQIRGHTLDLIITRTTDSIVVDKPIADSFLSDHATIVCHLKMPKVDLSIKTVSYRKMKSIDLGLFKTDKCASNLSQDTPTTLKVHLTPFSFFFKITCCILWSFSPQKFFDFLCPMEMSKIAIKCRHVGDSGIDPWSLQLGHGTSYPTSRTLLICVLLILL